MAMFGKKKDEPVVQPVSWTGGHWFMVGDVARPAAFRRKALTGPRAVRMPDTQEGVRYYAPVALVTQTPGTDEESASYELYDATEPGALLCALSPEKGGARYRVTDAQGEELGLVRRTPAAKRTIQHGWWLQQPGHPDIVARYHWAKGSAKDIATRGKETAVRGAGALVEGVVDSVLSFGAEGGDQASPSRTHKPVTWRAEGEEETVVLTSGHVEGVRTYVPVASWLDHRLAFALAVLREA
ncbi:hypothetical protein [Streptomyces sp. NBC_01236]|uniref:hypothetical protein n=1 Tax=Streptomyces sp. NBC_01236 TaxID=2903789 RepID=UPI002E121CC3|nr:hypothetical protein OG324_28745 [Streptomyces sp. NBC_01236]